VKLLNKSYPFKIAFAFPLKALALIY